MIRPLTTRVCHVGGAFASLTLVLIVTGCGGLTPPETGYTPSARAQAADYPSLLDLQTVDRLTLDDGTPRATIMDEQRILAERAAALRARAQGLGGPVIPPVQAERLRQAADESLKRL